MIIDTKKLLSVVCTSFLSIVLASIIQIQDVSAQRTVEVPQGFATLNEAIFSDTTETGERVDSSTVYVLSSGGTYLLDGSIEHRGFHLTIVAEDGWTERPKLIPAVGTGVEASRPFRPRGDLTIRGLYVTGEDELGGLTTRIIRVSENDVRIVVDNCHLDKDGQSGFRIDGTGTSIFLTNSIVSNIGTTDSPDNGRVLDDRGNDIDTLWFENNTFYNITSQVVRDDGEVIQYARYKQNTAYNIGKNATLELGPAVQAVIEDNIFINSSFYGYNTNDEDEFLYVIGLDSLTQDEIDTYGPQSVMANNNNIFLSSAISDVYPDTVSAPANFNPTAAAYIAEQGSEATFTNEDITFTSSPGAPTDIVTDFWNDSDDPAEFDNANAPFDFAYADTFTSYSGGSDGQQLGSLTWFGTLVNNEEDEPSLTIPSVFQLHGNYPNPFNPSTNISFNLAEAADVSVDVFNMIGQKVMSIPAQRMAAGANQFLTVDASFLSSGIYIYRVNAKAGNVVTTNSGRMTLIK